MLFAAFVALVSLARPSSWLDPISVLLLVSADDAINNINVAAVLDPPALDPQTFAEAFVDAFVAPHPRLLSVIRRVPFIGWCQWVELESFDPADHVHVHHAIIDHLALEQLTADLLGRPLAVDSPLWDLHLFPAYTRDDGAVCMAFVFRIHHVLGDGVTLARLFYSGFDGVVSPFSRQAHTLRTFRRPGAALPLSARFTQSGTAIWRLLFSTPDPPSALKRDESEYLAPTGSRVAAFATATARLAPLKAAARDLGVTINDVLLAVLAGALRTLALASSRPLAPVTSVVWVSLQPLRTMFTPLDMPPAPCWGNSHLGFVYVTLPLDQSDPLARVHAVHTQTTALLSAPDAALGSLLMAILGCIPRPILRPLWRLTAYKISSSMSNMPGPAAELSLAGRRLTRRRLLHPR
ncbi:diacylglycerol O-acyltransferase [Thecamonas trahens ATCC 50062]|uniref:Diacylglycerol O-acyltransferase n=1 Tax=Thecamonas trahens ATCC 50062 TaxID=461836 RepID=A0A0L0D9Q2_THETB|nr:diacylglycerol O-acyltransferase [Thecamonas trahens ATCC 50062]KNC48816.1 diacylglycerol O-acyltransferase [Thecamonas trahens ATCC 50062]|eukprot:XP_013762867.1 diacylglycerol O-acyltransferase [Thecamonas trahens ATCC 50062]